MKQVNRLLCILLCVSIILPPSLPVNALAIEDTVSTIDIIDEKIYCNATIDQNFAGDAVLVVLDSTVGSINKVHDKSYFGSVEIVNIVDLTAIPNYEEEKFSNEMLSQIDENGFRQIIKLELPIDSKENVLNVIEKLEKIDGILYAGPNYLSDSYSLTPQNALDIDTKWALDAINAQGAWNIAKGSSVVRVGIIDTGIANHPDLTAYLDAGWDFFNDNSVTTDDVRSHGTSIAGIIGAQNIDGREFSGVAYGVTLVPLQNCNANNRPDIESAIKAIGYAMNNNIPILNYSASHSENSVALKQAIGNYPGLFICGAGNDGVDIDVEANKCYPAAFDCANLITVANSDENDNLHTGGTAPSNFGDNTVHLAAPGTNIFTTDASGYFIVGTGSSAATAYVTGVAALIYSIRPDLTAAEIKNLILSNVDEVQALKGKCITGGRLNAYKAVRAATEPQTFTGDVDGDGRSDIILSRNIDGYRAITTYLGQLDGSFSNPITGISSRGFSYTDPVFSGDFNGDGLLDLVVHWSSNNRRQLLVYIGAEQGYLYEGVNLSSTRFHDPNQLPCKFFVADVNGDGCDDFVVHYRNTSGKRCALVYKGKNTAPYFSDATTDALVSTNTYYHEDPVYMGDFNGDGCADMMVQWRGENDRRQLLVYKGNSNGTFSSGVNLASTRAHELGAYPSKFFIADADGDNRDDYIVHWRNDSGYRCNLVYKGKTTSPYITDATTNALVSTNSYVTDDPVFMGDVNGDGRADMIVHWALNGYRQLLIYIANADGTYNAAIRQSTSNSHDPVNAAGSFYLADVNGDGRDDFIVKWRSGLNIRFLTYLGTASGSFTAAVRTYPQPEVPYYNET